MQPSPLDIRQRLRQRFGSAGLAESQFGDPGPRPDLAFQGDTTRVYLVILDDTHWADRQAFMDSIMRASALVGRVSRTYVVLPKMAASLADARVFQDQGIGLFTYDQRNLEEALPARFFETTSNVPHQHDSTAAGQLENEVRELRAQFASLERIVRELKDELAAPRQIHPPGEQVRTPTPPVPIPGISGLAGLPTFFAGNPWLEVLSKRSREETGVAG